MEVLDKHNALRYDRGQLNSIGYDHLRAFVMEEVTKERLHDLYVTQELSCKECAKRLGVSTGQRVSLILKGFGIPVRKGGFKKGNKVKHAKGGKAQAWRGGKKKVFCASCGKEMHRFPSQVKENNFCSKECKGRAKRKDYTGKRVGMLEVIKQDGKDKYGKHLWECLCDCGQTKFYTTSDLKTVKSCGCQMYKTGKDSPSYKKRIDFVCPICGEAKRVVPSYLTNHSTCGSDECRSKMISLKLAGKNNHKYIGGPNFYNYESGSKKISFAESTRRSPEDERILEVKCVKCNKWFKPTQLQVAQRIRVLYSQKGASGSCYFYCSDECKHSCSVYRKIKHPEGTTNPNPRNETIDPQTRQMALDRDNHQCQKCGSIGDLEVHHIEGVAQEPMLANDVDNLLTVCHNCHKEIHSQIGCTYHDYQRASCENTINNSINEV